MCFLIIKYLFISNISCNNKGLFKLNDSIIKLELNVTKKGNYDIYSSDFENKSKIINVTINGDIKTINSSGSYNFEELNINYVEIIMSNYVVSCEEMFFDVF